jgi:ribonucleoside-triphosphate reductase
MLRAVGKALKRTERAGGRLTGIEAMEIDHEIAQCIVSGGVRRSARMSIMHWRDPLIWDFLTIKALGGHWTTNISVEIDDEFIAEQDDPNSSAGAVFQAIAEGMLNNGEPGIWNSSLTAVGEVDGTYTTNPCGEATLTPWEPCNLGSVNLGAFVDEAGEVDDEGLQDAHRYLTRYLIRATFAKVSDPKSAEAIAKYRRIGVGHLGFADFLVKLGIKYSRATEKGIGYELDIMATTVDLAAREYANELRIPVPIKTRVIAPTGTTSKLAGVSGEATHPPFAGYFIRRIRFSDLEPSEVAQVEKYRLKGYHVEPDMFALNTTVVSIPTRDPLVDAGGGVFFQDAGQLSLRDMLNVQALYQEYWADQAVSYTINVDPKKYTAGDLMAALKPYLPKLKGTTVFPEMSFQQPPYERIDKATYEKLIAEIGEETTDTSYDEICASGACPI